jgi:hypothetical protein
MSNFITDENVSAALDYLAIDPHPVAETKFDLTEAENNRKRTYAELFLSADGKTVAEREAAAICAPLYIRAQAAEADAVRAYEAARARVNWASTVTELWRSVQANVRAAEKVR